MNNSIHLVRDRQTTDMGSYEYNINRRLMERNSFYQPSEQPGDRDSRESRDARNMDHYGEITGEFLDQHELDKGMPMRSGLSLPQQASDDTLENAYLDFNLYRERPSGKIPYFDPLVMSNNRPTNMGFAKLDDISTKILPQNPIVQSHKTLIDTFNEFNFGFLDKFTNSLRTKKSIIISPFSVMQCFCLLYVGSKNKTEKLLQNYFVLPDKKTVHTNLFKINQELMNSKLLSIVNLACCPNYVTVSEAYKSFVSRIGHFVTYDPANPSPDTHKINNIIQQSTGNLIKNFLTAQMLHSGALVLVNTVHFYSKWKQPFTNIKPEIFYGIKQKLEPMMTQLKPKHNYFEDSYNQILEMDYSDGVFAFGIILPKSQYAEPMVTLDQYNYYIDKLRPTELQLVKMPKFKTDSRYSIAKLFMKHGLEDIFRSVDISEIIPLQAQNVFVSDIMHAAVIEVDELGTKAAAATSMYMQNSISKTPDISFVANHQFLYYIRYKPYNLVLFTGQFY